ncbi:MAG: hypothetical protein IPH20_14250 [Bacteroidales bacterium]|nr:hypothetical protein [Bacteroidales bacterium]
MKTTFYFSIKRNSSSLIMIMSIFFFSTLIISSISAQQSVQSISDYDIMYYDGPEFFSSDVLGDSINYGVERKIKKSALIEGVECIYHVSQVTEDLKIEEGMVLWIGIRSPFNSDWLYLERDLFSDRYNLAILDHNTAEKTIISNEKNSPLQGLVLKPVSWSNHESIVYMEAFKFDEAEEHEGIYTFNLKTGEAHNLNLFTNYMSTPIFSPDRNMFFI